MVYLTDGTHQILAAPERGGGGKAVGGVLQKSDESFDKATSDSINPSVCLRQTSPLSGATRGIEEHPPMQINLNLSQSKTPSEDGVDCCVYHRS